MTRIINILQKLGAAEAAAIKYSDCDVINERLAERLKFTPKTVIIATLPYYTEYCAANKTISSYALAFDYHILLKNIAEKAINEAKTIYPHANFSFFGDHSPINEKSAAAKAGLGVIGLNSLLITPQHSSFVFLFEIITDLECNEECGAISLCSQCAKCIEACPTYLKGVGDCLSTITQKKGNLTEEESNLIFESKCVWGCDICQAVCPYTINAIKRGTIYSKSEWFNNNICAIPTEETISDESDFAKRAYSWRGKDTILRNIKILNGDK